jgi:Phage portal protein, SPP1 Gp6-like
VVLLVDRPAWMGSETSISEDQIPSATDPRKLAIQLLAILDTDEDRLEHIDRYVQGRHDDPYMPIQADDEYHLLARRCVSNWMPLLISTPAQALYVDGFRRGNVKDKGVAREIGALDEEWSHWQRSRLDARQGPIYKGALTFGHSFALTEKQKGSNRWGQGKSFTKGLSAKKTSAVFEDPANDLVPYAALTVTRWPTAGHDNGKARLWDGDCEYPVVFRSLMDAPSVHVGPGVPHGASECPVTRFAAAVDLEGRTVGVVEPMIVLNDRINQTVFDLLVAQTYGSFKVRTATGMAPPLQMRAILDESGQPTGESEVELDADGLPIPLNVNLNARRFLFAEDPAVKFSSLDETPLDGFINSINMSIRQLSSISQTPPHYLLGQIANLSAEALQAAETSLARKVDAFRKSFGESWERVFRLAAELDGDTAMAEDIHGEVLWRDMESRSLAQTADALSKLQILGIPDRGLWRRVPGVTQTELSSWEDMQDSEPAKALADAVSRAAPSMAAKIPAGTPQLPATPKAP